MNIRLITLLITILTLTTLHAQNIINVTNGNVTILPAETLETRDREFKTITIQSKLGAIFHDIDTQKSSKKESAFGNLYANVSTKSYLLEVNYGHLNTNYKNSATPNIIQHDIMASFTKRHPSFFYRGGFHYLKTTDKDLGDGMMVAIALGSDITTQNSKFSYGSEFFYTYYRNGHNELFEEKDLGIIQASPYLSFFYNFNTENQNSLTLKLNYILSVDFIQKEYISYELNDTYSYKKFFFTLKGLLGEMRSGVKEQGFVVINTLDLMKNAYSIEVGNRLTEGLKVGLSAGVETYTEYRKSGVAMNSIGSFYLSYSF